MKDLPIAGVMFDINGDNSMPIAWSKLEEVVRKRSGASDLQIESMQKMFYLGAAQAYALIAANSDTRADFVAAMDEIGEDISEVLPSKPPGFDA